MCQPIPPPASGVDEFFHDHPALTGFIETVNDIRARESDPHAIVRAIEPHFTSLLNTPDWLPGEFMEPKEGSGMGGGIGMWLLYRAGDGGLAFSSLVVPSGASTPVHDHLAWGLVGLYRGEQDEVLFSRTDDGSSEAFATLETAEQRPLKPGDMYELMPENDIHQVRTTSDVTSVSLHLLGNDNGCIWRHRFHPEEHRIEPFKSGWLNVPCAAEGAATMEKEAGKPA
jgi:predicted metal-dependent enzyme (double-stranded beta helix superfamily)